MFNKTDILSQRVSSLLPDYLSHSNAWHFSSEGLQDPIRPNNPISAASSVPPVVIPDPGSNPSQAFNVGALESSGTLNEFVGASDPNDYYQLNLSNPSSLNLLLNGLSADANLQLFNSRETLIASSAQSGILAESINISQLEAGTYYVRVYQSSSDTNYNLSWATTAQASSSSTLVNTQASAVTSTTTSSPFTSFTVVDASGDNTALTVLEEGALRLSYNLQGVTSLSSVRLEAIRNGAVVSTLGTWTSASLSDAVVNLASFPSLTAGAYQFRLVALTTTNQGYASTAQSLTVLTNSQINGTFAGDTLNYSAGLGTGAVFLGRGGTDTLNLGAAGITSANVTSINGISLAAFNPLSGSTNNQAIYGGTAWDYMTLSDGREIYFQGVEFLSFADGSTVELQVHPNDTYFGNQWNLAVTDVPSAWRYTQGASNVLLASLDTGILTAVGANGSIVDINSNRLLTNFWDDDNFNDYGHGHSAISIMAGAANNSSGIAGINWNSSVYVNDVYGGNTAGVWRITLQNAIRNVISYARATNSRVVFQGGVQGDLWLTDGGTQAQLEQLIQANSDIAVFALAAGNGGATAGDGVGAINDPNYLTSVSGVGRLETTYSNVISVGALQRTGTAVVNGMSNATTVNLAGYSNRGSNLTLVAPTDSLAMTKMGDLITFGGTSAANPNLAGIASLVWCVNPALTGTQVRQILADTAMDLGTLGRDNTFGYGLVNADAAVRRAAALLRNPQVANLYSGSSLIV
jgi:hypothetical protein